MTRISVLAASMVGLAAFPPEAHAADEVLAQSKVPFDPRTALLAPASAVALDRLVLRVKAIAPEMVSSRGLFRDEQPEVIELSGHIDAQEAALGRDMLSEERADTVKAYLVSRGLDPYRVLIEPSGAASASPERGITVRLTTFAPQKSFGASGKAGLRFPR